MCLAWLNNSLAKRRLLGPLLSLFRVTVYSFLVVLVGHREQDFLVLKHLALQVAEGRMVIRVHR